MPKCAHDWLILTTIELEKEIFDRVSLPETTPWTVRGCSMCRELQVLNIAPKDKRNIVSLEYGESLTINNPHKFISIHSYYFKRLRIFRGR